MEPFLPLRVTMVEEAYKKMAAETVKPVPPPNAIKDKSPTGSR